MFNQVFMVEAICLEYVESILVWATSVKSAQHLMEQLKKESLLTLSEQLPVIELTVKLLLNRLLLWAYPALIPVSMIQF